ncbi:hypothetical protein H0G86_007766 [Trichoderma simmonsii]|uniref:Uncharacterized protein n=1 Tax=Trichoderma simmonsii TaxID=1491479 RepID=A0A8G0LE44_9HYPO|nr:hypothetical protein H0G86_007766 [Trichoderma simmonsii]
MQHHVRRVAQELSRQADGRSHRIVACMNKTTGITQRKYVRVGPQTHSHTLVCEPPPAVQAATVTALRTEQRASMPCKLVQYCTHRHKGLACSASAAAPQSLF